MVLIYFIDKLFTKHEEHVFFIRNKLAEAKIEVFQAIMILA